MLLCGYSVYYFVLLIMQYYVLLPFLKPISRKGLAVTSLISGASILLVSYVTAIQGYSLPLLAFAGPFPVLIVFFALGIYLASTGRNYSLTAILVLLVCSIVWQYAESLYLYGFHGKGFGIKFSSFVYAYLLILLLFSRKFEMWYDRWNGILVKAVSYLGRVSYGVYLTHCYVISLVSRLLPDMDWLFKWFLVLVADVCIVTLGMRLSPRFSKKYLGFG